MHCIAYVSHHSQFSYGHNMSIETQYCIQNTLQINGRDRSIYFDGYNLIFKFIFLVIFLECLTFAIYEMFCSTSTQSCFQQKVTKGRPHVFSRYAPVWREGGVGLNVDESTTMK